MIDTEYVPESMWCVFVFAGRLEEENFFNLHSTHTEIDQAYACSAKIFNSYVVERKITVKTLDK